MNEGQNRYGRDFPGRPAGRPSSPSTALPDGELWSHMPEAVFSQIQERLKMVHIKKKEKTSYFLKKGDMIETDFIKDTGS